MNRSKVPALIVLAVSLLVFGRIAAPHAQSALMRMNGAVVPDGTSNMEYGGKPARMLSVIGHHADRPSDPPNAAAYHVLVIFPADSVRNVERVSTVGDVAYALTNEWELFSGGRKTVQRTFASDYDPLRKRVHIGGRRFALSRGNMFVVRYDEQGRQTVTQLRRTLFNAHPLDVSRAYQALVPGDPVIQDLLRYSSPRCPKRAAPAPIATGNA
ncbi:MAG TPA: hypothetical protein VF092_23905 [Longimicrobium sp.]